MGRHYTRSLPHVESMSVCVALSASPPVAVCVAECSAECVAVYSSASQCCKERRCVRVSFVSNVCLAVIIMCALQ